MNGLTPDAEYQYRVSGDGGKTYITFAFHAAPQVQPEYRFTYIVYGDMGTSKYGVGLQNIPRPSKVDFFL